MVKHRNIKFYSTQDLSSGFHLREIEAVFTNWDEYIKSSDVNTVIELHNVKKYIDNEMRLEEWSAEQFAEYKEKCKDIPRVINRFCNTISDSNIGAIYKKIERNYTDDFWSLICSYKGYQHITSEAIEEVLKNSDHIVWEVLHYKELSKAYGPMIAEHLSHNKFTAERLTLHFLAERDRSNNQLYFPEEFSQEMRNNVLSDYVECDNANINILQLLEQAQTTTEFPLSDKLRLKARKKKEDLQGKLFSGNPGMKYGAEVIFKSIPDHSVEESYKDGMVSCAYSREWIEENRDYPTLLNNFIYLFKYVDRYCRCNFISLQTELGVLERNIGINGKKDYITGIAFSTKRILSLLQMEAYTQELNRLNIQIENIFKWFFEDYLKDEFGANGFTYTPSSNGTTFAEKCKLLSIAIDGVLKQYRLFSEDGFVDRELLEMSSGHIVFSELLGVMKNKYAYAASKEICAEMQYLFSDQSIMSYTEKTKDKYQTLPQLLLSEQMKRDDFEKYQRDCLD